MIRYYIIFYFLCTSCINNVENKSRYFNSEFSDCSDLKYVNLELDVDMPNHSISGSSTMYLQSDCDIDTILIDLHSNLIVDSVLLNGVSVKFDREMNHIMIYHDITKNSMDSLEVYYQGVPLSTNNAPWDGGFVWSKDNNNMDWLGVACQKESGSLWWPNKHDLSDEPDSMKIILKVDESYYGVSNGSLLGIQNDSINRKKIFTWGVQYPINSYNVSINVADYVNFKDSIIGLNGLLELNYFVLHDNLSLAKKHFQQVKPMLHVFENLFGPYPFYNDGYKLVETSYLGMEHQSCISYGNKFLKGYLGSYPSNIDFDYIIIHETAHEWWGNSLSMKHIKDMWIHESFATYAEALYVENIYGYDQMLTYLKYQKKFIKNQYPIVDSVHFDTDMYYKGSWMLHTLRNFLRNDVLWMDILYGLQLKFQYKNVETDDVLNYIQEHYTHDLYAFFRQYLFSNKIPVFEYFFEAQDSTNFLYFKWNSIVDGFDMPISVKMNHWEDADIWLYPNSEWQKIHLNTGGCQDFIVNQDLFLINVLQVNE